MWYQTNKRKRFLEEDFVRSLTVVILMGGMIGVLGTDGVNAAVQPQDSSLTAEVSATVDPHPDSYVVVNDADSQSWVTDPLAIHAQAIDVALSNTSDATTSGWAGWLDPGSGTVSFATHWKATTQEPIGQDSGGGYSSDHSFSYSFMPEEDGVFQITYDIVGTGTSTFGFLYAYDLVFDGNFTALDLPNENPTTLAGTVSYPVTGFTTYSLDIYSFPNMGITHLWQNDLLTAEFNFEFIPTPQACHDKGTEYLDEDLNRDCYVNLLDFVRISLQWLQCTDPANSGCGLPM